MASTPRFQPGDLVVANPGTARSFDDGEVEGRVFQVEGVESYGDTNVYRLRGDDGVGAEADEGDLREASRFARRARQSVNRFTRVRQRIKMLREAKTFADLAAIRRHAMDDDVQWSNDLSPSKDVQTKNRRHDDMQPTDMLDLTTPNQGEPRQAELTPDAIERLAPGQIVLLSEIVAEDDHAFPYWPYTPCEVVDVSKAMSLVTVRTLDGATLTVTTRQIELPNTNWPFGDDEVDPGISGVASRTTTMHQRVALVALANGPVNYARLFRLVPFAVLVEAASRVPASSFSEAVAGWRKEAHSLFAAFPPPQSPEAGVSRVEKSEDGRREARIVDYGDAMVVQYVEDGAFKGAQSGSAEAMKVAVQDFLATGNGGPGGDASLASFVGHDGYVWQTWRMVAGGLPGWPVGANRHLAPGFVRRAARPLPGDSGLVSLVGHQFVVTDPPEGLSGWTPEQLSHARCLLAQRIGRTKVDALSLLQVWRNSVRGSEREAEAVGLVRRVQSGEDPDSVVYDWESMMKETDPEGFMKLGPEGLD